MAGLRTGLGLAVLLWAAQARAQQASVVQLPSYSIFGADTTVSAPDRGSVSLGGVGRASSGSTAFGSGLGPGNRASGGSISSSRSWVHATVQDLDALDRATLDRANRNRASRAPADTTAAASRLAAARQSSAGKVPPESLAEARRRRIAELQSQRDQAIANVKLARAAHAKGKEKAAALFYRIAVRQATGELKAVIEAESAHFAKAASRSRVAQDGGNAPTTSSGAVVGHRLPTPAE